MQKYIWVGLLLVMAIGVSSLSAQQEEPSEKSQIPKAGIKNESPPIDLKLTGIERELQSGTLHTNPAKIITPIVDPKLQGDWAVEPQAAPAKPGSLAVDPKIKDGNQSENSIPDKVNKAKTEQIGQDTSIDPNTGQKMDAPATEVTNYRDLKGESKQVIPEAQPGITNYRDMQGERNQPPGEKPK